MLSITSDVLFMIEQLIGEVQTKRMNLRYGFLLVCHFHIVFNKSQRVIWFFFFFFFFFLCVCVCVCVCVHVL